MVFTSYVFLFVFLPLLLLAHAWAPRRHRLLVLTAASYLFYGYWRFDFTFLLLFSTVVGWACGMGLAAAQRPGFRKAFVFVGVAANLGLLGYFKYFNFAMENLDRWVQAMGSEALGWEEVLLPVGVSFFTFQTISYVVDVYRGDTPPCRSLLRFACYVALFPQLVAGPIVRLREIAGDLARQERGPSQLARGVHLLLIGYNKKVLLADNLSVVADRCFELGDPSAAEAWLGLLAFSFQIYFDFSAYSDIAVGLGSMLGFRFPLNFDSPYKAESITDFWRRWHMTLSRWLRDYLYIPLGGNRRGPRRTYFNLMATMLLGGLWHGAQWTFLAWGAYHGLLLAWERAMGRRPPWRATPRPVRIALTWLTVTIGWLPFRAGSMETIERFARAMAGLGSGEPGAALNLALEPFYALTLGLAAVLAFFGVHSWRLADRASPLERSFQLAVFVLAIHQMVARDVAPFLYFQF